MIKTPKRNPSAASPASMHMQLGLDLGKGVLRVGFRAVHPVDDRRVG